MAKNEITDYDEVDSGNTDVSGIGLSDATLIDQLDDIARAQMGALARFTGDDTLVAAATTDLGSVPGRYVVITGNFNGITSFGTIKAGTLKFLKFSGTPTITYNATSMIIPAAVSKTAAAGDTAIVVSEGSGNWRFLSYDSATGQPIAYTPVNGFLFGLTLSNNGTDAVNDIDFATGSATDSTGLQTLVLASALTKRLDATWAVGTNQGGLDTGAIADASYFCFLIKRPDTGVVDAIFSLNTTSPTLPTNYTLYRRIGAIIRSGATIVGFVQDGDDFVLKVPVTTITATNPGTAAVSRAMGVPIGLRVEAMMSIGIATSTVSTDFAVLITDLSTTDSPPSVALADVAFSTLATAGTYRAFVNKRVMTNAGSQVRSRMLTSDASTTLRMNTYGWTDRRGRL